MVDIHTHILPGLDDGSRSLEESVDMAVIAAENGLNHIVASSHGNCFPYSIEEYWKQFQNLHCTQVWKFISTKTHRNCWKSRNYYLLTIPEIFL